MEEIEFDYSSERDPLRETDLCYYDYNPDFIDGLNAFLNGEWGTCSIYDLIWLGTNKGMVFLDQIEGAFASEVIEECLCEALEALDQGKVENADADLFSTVPKIKEIVTKKVEEYLETDGDCVSWW